MEARRVRSSSDAGLKDRVHRIQAVRQGWKSGETMLQSRLGGYELGSVSVLLVRIREPPELTSLKGRWMVGWCDAGGDTAMWTTLTSTHLSVEGRKAGQRPGKRNRGRI